MSGKQVDPIAESQTSDSLLIRHMHYHAQLPWTVEMGGEDYQNYLRFIVLFLYQGRGIWID